MDDFVLRQLEGGEPEDSPVEVVERKGKGHPDSICDAVAEEVSTALLRHYEEHFGVPLHYNVDKALLWAGRAEPAFGGGEVVRPMRLFVAGRATVEVQGVRIPVVDLATEAARRWLSASLHDVDPDRHVQVQPLLRPSSPELLELFLKQRGRDFLANDTSCGVGYAPFTLLERLVLEVERALTAPRVAKSDRAIGEDVKVMGVRRGERIEITVACALIGRHLPDLAAYGDVKQRVARLAREAVSRWTEREVDVAVNVADDPVRGSVYLTVTGTSAEAGDDGQAGRGNRVTGLITPYRPMVMESAPGKNPLSHTGKVYTLAAQMLAHDLVDALPEVLSSRCLLLSRIGTPVTRPYLVDVAVRTADGGDVERLRPQVRRAIDRLLESLGELARDFAGTVSALTSG